MERCAAYNDLLTPRQTVERLKSDGLPVSEYSLRAWIRTKQIPVARCGSKALLYYPNVVGYITGGAQIEAGR